MCIDTRGKSTRAAVVYEQMENDNRANKIHGLKINFGKFIRVLSKTRK